MKKAPKLSLQLLFILIFLLSSTCKDDIPRITKLEIGTTSNETESTATITANFIDVSENISSFGLCWATTSKPDVTDGQAKAAGTAKRGEFSIKLSGLKPSTKYFVRAYAMEGERSIYSSNEITCTTDEAKYINITTPQTKDIWTKGDTETITWQDNIDENVDITLLKDNETIKDIQKDAPSNGAYTWLIPSNLNLDTDYTIKIISTVNNSISGQSKAFEISENLDAIVITQDATSITGSAASLNGTVNPNGETVNLSFEWGATTAYGNSIDAVPATASGTTVTSITADIIGLTSGTTYHFRLKAGDVYGEDKEFKTITPNAPTVTTGLVSNIQYTTVSCGGEVTNGGTETVTERGICWDTSQNPTISDSYKDDEIAGIGVFSVDITGLTENTTYYVRAYATNSIGVSYGEQKDFKTEDQPIVVTNSITPDYITASGGGEVTHLGLGVDSKGICWSTSSNPTVDNYSGITTDGSGLGSFTSEIEDLNVGTTYHVRAYATNSLGTIYGNEQNFTTHTLTDWDGNEYSIVKIGNQIWMAENLKTTHYANGTAIPLVTDNTAWANLGDNDTDKAYCYYNNNAGNEADTYGALYTYAAATDGDNDGATQGVCPTGWHLPSDAEWKELEMYLGMSQAEADDTGFRGTDEGSKLAGNAALWTDGLLDANANFGVSCFSALPGGSRRNYDGTFFYVGGYGFWWSSTEHSSSPAYYRYLSYYHSDVFRDGHNKSDGFSVRCLRD